MIGIHWIVGRDIIHYIKINNNSFTIRAETGIVLAASGKTLIYLKGMMLIFGYLLRADKKYCTDFKLVL